MTHPEPPPAAASGTRAEVFAWAMYDWANSAYSPLSITILFIYLTPVVFLPKDPWGPTVWAGGISLSMLIAAALSPVLGAMADANSSKRTWLACTALPGAAVVVVLAMVPMPTIKIAKLALQHLQPTTQNLMVQ